MSRSARGIFLSRNLDELIVKATDGDIAQFAAGTPVSVAGPPPPSDASGFNLLDDQFLYDRHGRAVAIVESVETSCDRFDVTARDAAQRFIAGPVRVSIRATGLRP